MKLARMAAQARQTSMSEYLHYKSTASFVILPCQPNIVSWLIQQESIQWIILLFYTKSWASGHWEKKEILSRSQYIRISSLRKYQH
jgi:hypothetical protein